MKVHQFGRGFWDPEPSLTLGCKRFRPLPPPTTYDDDATSASDLKNFIRPDNGPRKLGPSDQIRREKDSHSLQVETHPGGTRWNPTLEQIGTLEMLYRGGMRTPSSQQIEQITEQLGKYGKIEGKNVFYWFQNHKARERQKQKRNSAIAGYVTRSPSASAATIAMDAQVVVPEDSPYKRKCISWSAEGDESRWEGEGQARTLELFPLHPEGRL